MSIFSVGGVKIDGYVTISYGCVILTAGLDKEKFIQRKVNHKPAGHVF